MIMLYPNPCYNKVWYTETGLKQPLKDRQNKGLKVAWYLNAGQKDCIMLHGSIMQYF